MNVDVRVPWKCHATEPLYCASLHATCLVCSHDVQHERNIPKEPAMAEFQVQRLDHLVLRVRDLARSLQFYQQVLGCTVARERPDLGLVHLRLGVSMLDLISLDGPLGARGGTGLAKDSHNLDHFCVRIEPFDEASLLAFLAQQRVEVLAPASINYGAEGEGWSVYIRDPDGNVVELKGPAR